MKKTLYILLLAAGLFAVSPLGTGIADGPSLSDAQLAAGAREGLANLVAIVRTLRTPVGVMLAVVFPLVVFGLGVPPMNRMWMRTAPRIAAKLRLLAGSKTPEKMDRDLESWAFLDRTVGTAAPTAAVRPAAPVAAGSGTGPKTTMYWPPSPGTVLSSRYTSSVEASLQGQNGPAASPPPPPPAALGSSRAITV